MRAVSGQVGQITPILHIWTGFRFGSASPKWTAVLSHSVCLLLSSDETEFDVDTVTVYRSCCQERVLSLCTDTCFVSSLHWNWRTAASNQVEHNSHAAHTTARAPKLPPSGHSHLCLCPPCLGSFRYIRPCYWVRARQLCVEPTPSGTL